MGQGSTKKFLMISNAGEVLEEYYLEMQRMPSNSNAIGQINYIDGEGSKDEIEFKHTTGADKFVAWHHNSPEHTFCMTPVMHNEYIVGMTVNLMMVPMKAILSHSFSNLQRTLLIIAIGGTKWLLQSSQLSAF